MKTEKKTKKRKPQHQRPPGIQSKMQPVPHPEKNSSRGSDKLLNKVAIITGGDSGIGRAVAVEFAKEGANVVVVYLKEHADAKETQKLVEQKGRECLLIAGDVGKESFCKTIVHQTIQQFERIDILINNATEQHPQKSLLTITEKQLERTFRTNIFSYFFLTNASFG